MTGKAKRGAQSAVPYSKKVLYAKGPQRSFTGAHLDQIAFPLGGIGAGQINLGGSGNLIDFSIFNKPNLGNQPFNFASITAAEKGKTPIARVIEGPVTQSRIYAGGKWGRGFCMGHEGFPHMAKAVFRGEFPFARIDFSEPTLPVSVSLEAWSPFIPLDDRNSSIPAGILNYTIKNRSKKPVKSTLALHMAHMIFHEQDKTGGCVIAAKSGRAGNGLLYYNDRLNESDPNYATFAVATTNQEPVLKAGWFRGGWFDPRTMLWKEIELGRFSPQEKSKPVQSPIRPGMTGGTVAVPVKLAPGETQTVRLILAWHSPFSDVTHGHPKQGQDCGCDSCGPKEKPKGWRPYYAGQWKDAWAVAQHVARHIESLESRTRRFKDVFFSSTVPPYVLDAVSANLGILKSPTVLRLEDGMIWGYEGCHCDTGCCAGSCTHVWNYAQSIPHLFPQLERTLREQELAHSMADDGYVYFRTPLPVATPVGEDKPGGPNGPHVAAADGQLGGIMKVYRDWHLCGDDEWLKKMYPLAKRSLDYCIGAWDPDRNGALFEMHHNTYDIEFYGPDGMCTSVYLGALLAASKMAEYLGRAEEAESYAALAETGRKYCDKHLYNGAYYHQKVMGKGLRHNFTDSRRYEEAQPEVLALCKKEGPMYQYGDGCLSDGIIGQWFAEEYGLPYALDPAKTRSTLKSIFQSNFKSSLRDHSNPQRATYALNDEAGLLLCSWPKGGKPSLPFVYSDEVWTGIEYQVASHLIREGFTGEGLTIVKAVRDRHEGLNRNPWNEYECGSYYARAMASYAVLTGLTGFRYSAVDKQLSLKPQLKDDKIVSFFSTHEGWGSLTVAKSKKGVSVTITVVEGQLALKSLRFIGMGVRKKSKDDIVIPLPKEIAVKAGKSVVFRCD